MRMTFRILFRILTVFVLVALSLSTGCKKRPRGGIAGTDPTGGMGGDSTYLTGIEQDGLPLTGDPFNLSRTPLTGVAFAPVYFGYDSFQLAPEEIAKIEQVADHMNQNPGHVLIVEGHCDERGSNEYNLSLGEQRALSVRSYLVNLGIAAERIQSRSLGEERPAAMGNDESAWRLNRRGEFALYN